MKKTAVFLSAIAMVALVACGNPTPTPPPTPTPVPTVAPPPPPPPPPPAAWWPPRPTTVPATFVYCPQPGPGGAPPETAWVAAGTCPYDPYAQSTVATKAPADKSTNAVAPTAKKKAAKSAHSTK